MNAKNSTVSKPDNCFQEAWDYRTEMGTSDYSRWYYTNQYYETHCL